MNAYFAAAGGLAFMVGLAHSILGERLVFVDARGGVLVAVVAAIKKMVAK